MKKDSKKALSKDYDYYSIPVPLNCLSKKRRDRYLYSELVKRHPCFSDSCCYDSKLRITKKGIWADIVVIQKSHLAEYKKRSRKKSLIIYSAAIVLVLCSIAFLSYRFMDNLRGQIKPDKENSLQTVLDLDYNTGENLIVRQRLPERVISFVADNGGSITSFDWKIEGFTEYCLVRVKNIYPENLISEFPDAVFSAVTFENENPVFSIELTDRIKNVGFAGYTISESFISSFRNLLKSKNVIILEENCNPYGVKLVVTPQSVQPAATLKEIFECIRKEQISARLISVSSGKDGIHLALSFSKEDLGFTGQLYTALIENARLFIPENNKETLQVISKSPPEQHVSILEKSEGMRIGRMIKKDGTVIEFFKNEKGKIVKK